MSEPTWDQVEHGGRLAYLIWSVDPKGKMTRADARVIADELIMAGYTKGGGKA